MNGDTLNTTFASLFATACSFIIAHLPEIQAFITFLLTVAFLVYQIGTLITTGALGAGFVPGLVTVLLLVAIVVTIIIVNNRKASVSKKGMAAWQI